MFPILGYRQPGPKVSTPFGELCVRAGLTRPTDDGRAVIKWSLHCIRMKADVDIERGGGSIRDQMALTGHKSVAVNVQHYQWTDHARMRKMVDNLGGFAAISDLRMPA